MQYTSVKKPSPLNSIFFPVTKVISKPTLSEFIAVLWSWKVCFYHPMHDLENKKKICWKESWGKKHAHISLQVNNACKQKAGFSTPTHWQPLYKQGRHSFGYAWGENKHREVTTNSNAWMTSPLKLDKQWPIHEGGELTRGIQKPEVPLVCHVKLSLLSERGGVGP